MVFKHPNVKKAGNKYFLDSEHVVCKRCGYDMEDLAVLFLSRHMLWC